MTSPHDTDYIVRYVFIVTIVGLVLSLNLGLGWTLLVAMLSGNWIALMYAAMLGMSNWAGYEIAREFVRTRPRSY